MMTGHLSPWRLNKQASPLHVGWHGHILIWAAKGDGAVIDARLVSVGEALRLGRFEPASVQREFQWSATEVERMLVDLLDFMGPLGFEPAGETALASSEAPEAEEDEDDPKALGPEGTGAVFRPTRKAPPSRRAPQVYFLGQIVLHPSPGAAGLYRIYDGFQRFTTLIVLLSVLRDSWRDEDAPELDALAKLLCSNEPERRLIAPTPGGAVRRLSSARTRSFFLPRGSSLADHRIRDARDLLLAWIKPWEDAERRQFLGLLLSKVVLSAAIVENRSVAYQIFVGANARGMRLDLSDVLKGKIVELIDRAYPGAKGEQYARKWNRLRRELRRKFDDLLSDAELIRYKSQKPHHPGELLIAEIDDAGEDVVQIADELAAWIDGDLTDFAAAFQRLRAHHQLNEATGADLALRQLSFLSWNEWRPIAIALDLWHRDDPDRRAVQLRRLQKACYLLELMGWSEQGRRAIALKALEQIEADRNPFFHRKGDPGEPDYAALRFSAKMRAKAMAQLDAPFVSATQRGAVVRWLETLMWESRVPRQCTDDADIEHILPQALKDGWERDFTDDEHEYWKHRLGNLCLLPRLLNFELQTSPWSVKRAAYLDLDNGFRLAAAAAAFEQWTPEAISARHRTILGKAVAALRY